MFKGFALILLSLLAVPTPADAAQGNSYYGRLDFSGTSTTAADLYLQIRDGAGTSACATSEGFSLLSGTTAVAARDSVALGWRIIDEGNCFDGSNVLCRLFTYDGGPSIGLEVTGASFTVFASTDSSSWTQITPGTPYGFGGGLQVGVGSDTGSNVPTLTEWGLIALAVGIGLGGLWTLQRSTAAA